MIFAAGSALDHVLDTYVWHFFHETLHFHIPLPSFTVDAQSSAYRSIPSSWRWPRR